MSDPAILRTFAQLLGDLEDGRFNGDVSEALRDLIAAIENAAAAAGKASGTLTLKLGFKLADGVMEVAAEHKVAAPKLARGRSIFWVTPDNNLTRSNPRQSNLPFRDVTVPAAQNALA